MDMTFASPNNEGFVSNFILKDKSNPSLMKRKASAYQRLSKEIGEAKKLR